MKTHQGCGSHGVGLMADMVCTSVILENEEH
jgi:hypothetical protein